MELGKVLKEIRLNRGYSQLAAAHKIISQGVYSKVEAGTRDLDAVAFIKIANRMNLTADEIEFISNDYEYNEKQQIINAFFQLNYNNPEKLQEIKKQAMTYLTEGDDVELREIILLCDALLIVSNSGDLEEARNTIEPIWNRLVTYSQWYLYDIRLINMILFMYPLEIIKTFTERVLERLNDYSNHEKVNQLKSIFTVNLTLQLIKSHEFEEALNLVEELLIDRKKMNYTRLALCLSRLAICKKVLNIEGYEEAQQAVRNILMAYEDINLLERLEEEFEKYTISV